MGLGAGGALVLFLLAPSVEVRDGGGATASAAHRLGQSVTRLSPDAVITIHNLSSAAAAAAAVATAAKA